MKFVAFELEGVLFSDKGEERPYFRVVLDYCFENAIRLIFVSKHGAEICKSRIEISLPAYISRTYGYSITDDAFPNLYITTDGTIKKYPTLIVPYYNTAVHNKYSELVLAGKVLEALRNRVVLNKTDIKIEPKAEQKPPENDVTKYGFSI